MKTKLLRFLQIFGIIILFLGWFFLGMGRMKIASLVAATFSFLPFISILDTGITSILFIILNGIISWICFFSIPILKKTIIIHFFIYILVVMLTLLYKYFQTRFLFNLSENLLRFYFSPLIPLFFILVFYIIKKLEN